MTNREGTNGIFVGLGSNLDNPESQLKKARSKLDQQFTIERSSSILTTEPWKTKTNRTFKNQVVALRDVAVSPNQLLNRMLSIEESMGRDRTRNSPDRKIDLDLLYYDDRIIDRESLKLPHPGAHKRPFILKSMVELNPVFLHPVLDLTQVELLVKVRLETNN